jgi:hypothetical protein
LIAAGSFSWQWAEGLKVEQRRIDAERAEQVAAAHAEEVARQRAETRHRLEAGFAQITSRDGMQGAATLEGLADERDSVAEVVRTTRVQPGGSLSSLLPDLVEETYRHGMSALSDALHLLQSADGPQRRRLEEELEEIEERVDLDRYEDDASRDHDQQRLTSKRALLERQRKARQRARDLIFGAEQCASALAEARIELASVRADDTQLDADAVTRTLQDTIRGVREVQDELRRLGY